MGVPTFVTASRFLRAGLSMGAALLCLIALLIAAHDGTAASALAIVRHVNAATGSDSGGCTNPLSPCDTIGYALGRAANGDSIWVAAGIYIENLVVTKPVALLGGYAVSGSAWLPGTAGSSVIDGSGAISQPVVTFDAGADGAILDGFTITGGSADQAGGGITIEGASPFIRSCIVQGNTAVGEFEWGGGGILVSPGAATVISNTIIMSNSASGGASGIRAGSGSSLTLINSVIAANAGRWAIHANDASMTLTHVTIADHGVDGGILLNNSRATIRNSIVWEALAPDIEASNGSAYTVTYSNVEGGVQSGAGNLSANPKFIGGGDYHLKVGSPVIDKGTPLGAPATDLDGTPRDGAPDMGAYEWVGYRLYLPAVMKNH